MLSLIALLSRNRRPMQASCTTLCRSNPVFSRQTRSATMPAGRV